MLFTTDRTFCPLNFASTELRLIEVSGPFLTLKYITSTICYDPTDKTVAVIGNDASAAGWGGRERQAGPEYIPQEQMETFTNQDTYFAFRKDTEDRYWRGANAMKAGTKENSAYRVKLTEIMHRRLVKKPGLAEKIIPDLSPHCRRLTPGPGYLEALTEENVEYIQTPISRFTATGIETVDGSHREVDAI
ncbi:hypothetical protein F66182_14380, partial [Fusarium sp. NRRL 66182]